METFTLSMQNVKTYTKELMFKNIFVIESAKLRALPAKNVLVCQRVLRAYVLTCQRALRAYLLTFLRALRAYVLTCLRALRAYVLTYLACLRANVPCVLTS